EAVADAVKAAVVQAGQTVLTEGLTKPEGLGKLGDALPPPSPPPGAKPAAVAALAERVGKVWSWLGAKGRSAVGARQGGLNRLGEGVACMKQRVQQAGQSAWQRLRLLRPFGGQLLLAAGVGVAAGVAAFLAAPWLAAVLSGLGGFMTAVVVQGGVLLLRLAAVSCPPRT